MLALTFFVSVFSTVFWLIYATLFVSDKLQGISPMNLGLWDASVYAAFILVPVFFLWAVFGHINQYIANKNVYGNLSALMKQMKKNMDYTDLVARILLEAEQEIKDGFMLNKFDVFIADMNEVLSEIIRRCSLASSEQIENLWTKVQNGGKWSFGKVIIEISQNQSDFAQRTINRARNDVVLAGSLLEFSARYQSLINLLERHDKEHVFLNMVETGVFGKVFSIIAPIADEVKRSKQNSANRTAKAAQPVASQDNFSALMADLDENQEEVKVTDIRDFKPVKTVQTGTSIVSKLNVFRKKMSQDSIRKSDPVLTDKDPFTIALERSFGSTEEKEPENGLKETSILSINLDDKNDSWHDENQLDIEDFTGHVSNKNRADNKVAEFSETRKTLNTLRKEWNNEKKEQPAVKAEAVADEPLLSPFSNWTDEIIEKR